jgi:glutathione S-transferase
VANFDYSVKFAFPKEMEAREGEKEFPNLCGKFYPGLKTSDALKAYLESDRRAAYSQGIFRHYPELDRQ